MLSSVRHRKKPQNKMKGEEKSNDEKTTIVIEELVVFSVENQPCVFVMRYDSNWLVGSRTTHNVTSRKDVFVTSKWRFWCSEDEKQ